MLLVPRVLGVATAYLAFIATEFGTWVAILVYAYVTSGPLSVGLVAVVQLVPAAIVAPFAAMIGERFARDRALAAAYGLLALTMGATGVAMVTGAHPFVVYGLAVLAQASLTTVRPMQAAIIPGLVGTADQLTSANALSVVLDGVGGLLGPLAAGVILAVAHPGAAFVAAAVACAAASLLVLGVAISTASHHELDTVDVNRDAGELHQSGSLPSGVPDQGGHAAPEAVERGAGAAQRAEVQLLHGIRAVRNSSSGMLVIGLIGSREIVAGALDVLLVIAAVEYLGMGESGAGYLGAALGLGGVLGGASTLALAGRHRIAPFLLLGALAWGFFVVLVALVATAAAALAFLVGAGAGLAILHVSGRTLLQRLMPVDALAGAFGVLESSIFGGLAVGALVAGPLVAILGLDGAIVTLGLAVPVLTLLAFPIVLRGEQAITIPFREIALLRKLVLFAPVPAPALESAARRLVPITAPPGTAIVAEGEIGDRFYVIVSGTVLVRREGRDLRTLGPGDSFGEIALINRVPRTATVTAVDTVDLRALERNDFLLAITGTPQALEEAERAARTHQANDAARAAGSA